MVQLYIKHTDANYYLLDLEETEAINFKLTAKDLTDISKIFAPFTQTFKIKASDKNKILLGFYGNEKIVKENTTGTFDSLLYISGQLFESGVLTPDETAYEQGDQKTINVVFASNLTSLVDKLGDTTIQELFQDSAGAFDPLVKISWGPTVLKGAMESIKNLVLANGIMFKYVVPFISNLRVWTYDADNLNVVDNIAYKAGKIAADVNFISREETRPAINYMSVMDHLVLKIGTPIICPLFDEPELKEAFIWGSSESLTIPSAQAFPLVDYSTLLFLRYDVKQEIENAPNSPKWIITKEGTNGVFKVKRAATFDPNYWGNGFDLTLGFASLTALEGTGTKIKVVTKRASDGVILNSQEIINSLYTFRIIDIVNGQTMLDQNGELLFSFEILPLNLVNWSSITFQTQQAYRHDRGSGIFGRVTRVKFQSSATNSTLASQLGGNQLNLITILPKMKCTDFLRSFFKTFNISVISTGLNDQSMYWLTPDNINEANKPYSKRIVDFSQYVETATLSKKKASEYNQYSFAHFASKYYGSQFGDGSFFGALSFPEVAPAKPTKFEVKTDYSIMANFSFVDHPNNIKTCYGFLKEEPEILANGSRKYKPVYEELTIFYLNVKTLGVYPLSVEFSETANAALYAVAEATFKASNGKTLAFGAENVLDTDSLYLNYYSQFIELLLGLNTFSSEFILSLPPNEIFLNFANLKQGESNIPTGYRAQNEIIIGEQRYFMIDTTINTTTGKTKLTAINF
jgi:hypothetical protein